VRLAYKARKGRKAGLVRPVARDRLDHLDRQDLRVHKVRKGCKGHRERPVRKAPRLRLKGRWLRRPICR
jgi:hypothetical protein